MPPVVKHSACVLLYDVNTSPDFAEASKKCLLNIFASKWFMDSKDLVQLILLNTADTNNTIHSRFGKCPHVYEATNVIKYDPKLLLEQLQGPFETAKGNWLMGLAVAIESIKENFYDNKGVVNLQILFVSDLTIGVEEKANRIAFIANNVNDMNILLYIIGPHVKTPRYMSTFEDIQEWSQNVEFVSSDRENSNYNIAKQIIKETKGVICDLELGAELFKSYWKPVALQSWIVPLTIGSLCTISCSTKRFLRSIAGPKFKSVMSGAGEPWKWHLADDIMVDIPYENVVGGVFKHDKFIALTSDVEQNFKYYGPRGFKIIGFTEQTNIPEIYKCGTGSCYVESEKSKTLDLLINVLEKQKKCAIAQRVYMKNSSPKLTALFPDVSRGVFIFVELPYGDSIKAKVIEDDVNSAPVLEKTPVVESMFEYLAKLDVSDPTNRIQDGSVKVPLAPGLKPSIRYDLMTQKLLNIYLECDEEKVEVNLPTFLEDVSEYRKLVPVRVPVT